MIDQIPDIPHPALDIQSNGDNIFFFQTFWFTFNFSGGSGDDTLLGEFGPDSIADGLGRDILIGVANPFAFVAVTASASRDLIKDFEDGVDRIDLRQIEVSPAPDAEMPIRLNGLHTPTETTFL